MKHKTMMNWVDTWTEALAESLLSILINFGSVLAPIVSGTLFGIGMYEAVVAFGILPVAGTVTVGILAAVLVEVVGVTSARALIEQLVNGEPYWLSAIAVVVYLVVGAGTLWMVEELGAFHKIMTTAMFALVAVNYGLMGQRRVKEHKIQEEIVKREEAAAEAKMAYKAEQARLQREAEAEQARLQREAEAEQARLQREVEAEERRRAYEIEDAKTAFEQNQLALNAEAERALSEERIALERKELNAKIALEKKIAQPTRQDSGMSAKRKAQLAAVRNALAEVDTFNSTQVASALNVSQRTSENIIKTFVGTGHVKPNGKRGMYMFVGK